MTATLSEFLLARIAERDLFWEVVGDSGQAHPDRVRRYRAESEAMRRIVDLHGIECWPAADGDWYGCEACTADDVPHPAEVRCPTLCVLAAVYADHPDYRMEWKP